MLRRLFVLWLVLLVPLVTFTGCTSDGPTTLCLEKWNPDTGEWEATSYKVTVDVRSGHKSISVTDGTHTASGTYNQSGSNFTSTMSGYGGGTIDAQATANADGTYDFGGSGSGMPPGWPTGGKVRAVPCPQ